MSPAVTSPVPAQGLLYSQVPDGRAAAPGRAGPTAAPDEGPAYFGVSWSITGLTWAPKNSLPLGSFLTESVSFTGRPAETTTASRESKGPGPLWGLPRGHEALLGRGQRLGQPPLGLWRGTPLTKAGL